jgi:hypothetical protein
MSRVNLVPRQNLIRAECGAILSSRYSVQSLNLIRNCFEEREVLSGAGTSVRACSAYTYKDKQKVGPDQAARSYR